MTCLPRFIAAIGDGRVQVVGRHDLDGVEVLLFLQQLAEVGVRRAGLELLLAPLAWRSRRPPPGGPPRGRRGSRCRLLSSRDCPGSRGSCCGCRSCPTPRSRCCRCSGRTRRRSGSAGSASRAPSSRNPCVPMPMWASVILSLGATCPAPPSTCRGTMANTPDAAAAPTNLRRLISMVMGKLPQCNKRSLTTEEADRTRRGRRTRSRGQA